MHIEGYLGVDQKAFKHIFSYHTIFHVIIDPKASVYVGVVCICKLQPGKTLFVNSAVGTVVSIAGMMGEQSFTRGFLHYNILLSIYTFG